MDFARETPGARSLYKLVGTFLWVRITDKFLPPGLISNLIVVLGVLLLLIHQVYFDYNDHWKPILMRCFGYNACITDTNNTSKDGKEIFCITDTSSRVFVQGTSSRANENVFLDSGSYCHATGNKDILDQESIKYGLFGTVTVGDGSVLAVSGLGCINRDNLKLACVLYVPGLVVNVVSVCQLTEMDYQIQFIGDEFFVREVCTDGMVGRGRLDGGMYLVDYLKVPLVRGRCRNCLILGRIYDQS